MFFAAGTDLSTAEGRDLYCATPVRASVRMPGPQSGAAGAAGAPAAGSPVIANVFLKTTGGAVFAAGQAVAIEPGGDWMDLQIDQAAPAFVTDLTRYDRSQTNEIGIEIDSGPNGIAQTVEILVDDVHSVSTY